MHSSGIPGWIVTLFSQRSKRDSRSGRLLEALLVGCVAALIAGCGGEDGSSTDSEIPDGSRPAIGEGTGGATTACIGADSPPSAWVDDGRTVDELYDDDCYRSDAYYDWLAKFPEHSQAAPMDRQIRDCLRDAGIGSREGVPDEIMRSCARKAGVPQSLIE